MNARPKYVLFMSDSLPGAAWLLYNPHPSNLVGDAMTLRKSILVILVGFALIPAAYAQDHWVTTWAAAPQQPRGGGPPPAAAQAAAAGQRGQAAPGAPAPAPTSFNDQTIRMIV